MAGTGHAGTSRLSAAAPAPPRTGPAPPSQAAATCDPFSQSGGGASTYTFDAGSGLRQPLPQGLPVASCSLRANATGWNYADVRVVEWDPVTLTPDPQTVALRAVWCNPSAMNYYTTNSLPKLTFVPPIITRSLAGVADPPREQAAFEVTESPSAFPYTFVGYYEPEGDVAMPAAVTFGSTPGLAGSHPVSAFALCDGGVQLSELRVVQSVRRTDSTAPVGHDEYLQRFRVPEAVEVRWVELALDILEGLGPPPVTVSILDATSHAEPPQMLPPALIEAPLFNIFYYQPGPLWSASADFDQTVQLMPGRDYWLSLRSAKNYKYRTHTLTANEEQKFQYAIGAFHHRALSSDPWTLASNQVLSFKIVGRSLGSPLSVTPRTGFMLSVTPNPSHAAPEAAWSGATGPVRLQVFDARGRRVASGSGGAAGRWVIAAGGSRVLGSGVYFVHAEDSEGAKAVERLVIVR